MNDLLRRLLASSLALALAIMGVLVLSSTAAAGGPTADVWAIHAAPFANTSEGTSVTVDVISGTTSIATIEDFVFGETTGAYAQLPAGTDLDVEITPTGGSAPVLTGTYNLPADAQVTLAAIGGANGWPLELYPLVDDNTIPTAGNAKLRVVHLAPFAATSAGTEVDIRTQDGAVVGGLTNVPYKTASGYLTLPYGVYDLKITTPGGGTTIIDIPPVALADSAIYTAIAVGDGQNQTPTVLLLQQAAGATAIDLGSLNATSGMFNAVPYIVGLTVAGVLVAGVVVSRRRA